MQCRCFGRHLRQSAVCSSTFLVQVPSTFLVQVCACGSPCGSLPWSPLLFKCMCVRYVTNKTNVPFLFTVTILKNQCVRLVAVAATSPLGGAGTLRGPWFSLLCSYRLLVWSVGHPPFDERTPTVAGNSDRALHLIVLLHVSRLLFPIGGSILAVL